MADKNIDKIDPLLLELLCCPACKSGSELKVKEDGSSLSCSVCQKSYALKKVPGPDNKGMLIPDLILLDS